MVKQVRRNIFNNPKIFAITAKIPTRIPAKISCETAVKFIAFDVVAALIHAYKARSSASVARHHHAICGKSIVAADLVVFFHRLARRIVENLVKFRHKPVFVINSGFALALPDTYALGICAFCFGFKVPKSQPRIFKTARSFVFSSIL